MNLPFNLEAAKKGAKLVTRDGRNAKFIAHVPEAAEDFRVISMTEGNNIITIHRENGRVSDSIPFRSDLFIKPSTIMIGGREVPEPCREPLEIGQVYWLVSVQSEIPTTLHWSGGKTDMYWLQLGLVQLTKEGAIAQRAATLRLYRGGV